VVQPLSRRAAGPAAYGDRVSAAAARPVEDPTLGTRAVRWGTVALLLRPAYIPAEIAVAAATTGDYSLVADSVSTLGEVGCSAAYCSPWHGLMNASFIVVGALLVAGAFLLRRQLGPWVAVLLVVSGLSSVATGLAPLDRDATVHALAAAPLFVAQPLGLLLLGARVRADDPRLGRALLATGAVTGVAAVGFVLSGPAAGALERLALWPVILGLAAYAWRLRARPAYASRGVDTHTPRGVG
jgi:hypothetical membrane protein